MDSDAGLSITLLVKEIQQGGIMQIKGLLRPVGTADGSANLTLSAILKIEESVKHANFGTNDYVQVSRRLEDALVNAGRRSG